jgi:signal transduction histidine kinase
VSAVPVEPPRPSAQEPRAAPRLSRFIRENAEPILAEWEAFARSLPGGGAMDVAALRDHAKEMLLVIAADLERPQSDRAQDEKARGERDADDGGGGARGTTAAQEHGTGRAGSGFTVGQMVAEFRALRASVTRLWLAEEAGAARTDLADLIRFNEAIDQAIAESVSRFSQAVGRTQERFLAILSHDLRTPLGAIITSTRFMLDAGGLEEPNRTLVARASTSARRMNQMVLDLVEFTRTRLDDAIPVVRAAVDGRRLVHDVVVEIAASYADSVVQVETGGDLWGAWDADRLTQALTNLVGNAVQHGTPGTPVRVAARGLTDEVTLSVHNEGPPIAEARQAAIFREGERAHAAWSRMGGFASWSVR